MRESAPRASPANYGDWFRTTPEEYLRLDQCLMSEVLRFGGAATGAIAQDGLNQPPERLRVLANREYWDKTPLAVAFGQDREADERVASTLRAQNGAWEQPLQGLEKPGGIGDIDFRSPPGTWPSDDRPTFHSQTGLINWIGGRFYKREGDFYDDPTPQMDEATLKAVDAIGLPLYGHAPDPRAPDWDLALAERSAFERLREPHSGNKGADDARIFLASGGFPRTAPERGSPEFRIAVEDMKSRFASCAWSDPLDPGKVLQPIVDTAATEWQQEIASQATQRNQVLSTNKDAVKSLSEGAKTLGSLLGQSWIADRLAYWQDFWSAGGIGWIGDSPVAIQVPGAKGKCLDVDNGGEKNGTPVQVYPCNGTAAQQWFVEGGGHNVHLRNHKSMKCLDVSGSKAENGRKIQIWDCNQSPAQTWDFNLRATTPLKNVGTGMCLDLNKFDNGHDAWLWGCNGTSPQQYKVQPSGHKGTDSLDYPDKAQFDQAQKGVAATQVEAKRLARHPEGARRGGEDGRGRLGRGGEGRVRHRGQERRAARPGPAGRPAESAGHQGCRCGA